MHIVLWLYFYIYVYRVFIYSETDVPRMRQSELAFIKNLLCVEYILAPYPFFQVHRKHTKLYLELSQHQPQNV